MSNTRSVIPYAAQLTSHGRGAVATIGYIGDVERIDEAGLFRAANGRALTHQQFGHVLFGRWGEEPGEELVLCRTTDNELEIHCHGGIAAVNAILSDLESIGCNRISGWDFVERQHGQFQRLATQCLANAPTPRTAEIIAHQLAGPFRQLLTDISTDRLDDQEIIRAIDDMRVWRSFAEHLITPWSVILFGRPNVGKSSLMNVLAGFERSIVLDVPGTTRDLVTAELALDGWPVSLIDSAGLRDTVEEIESTGVSRAKTRMSQADLRVLVIDCSQSPTPEDQALLSETQPQLIVANKSDLADAWNQTLPANAIPVSAVTRFGVEELASKLVSALIPRIPADDRPLPLLSDIQKTLDVLYQAIINTDPDASEAARNTILSQLRVKSFPSIAAPPPSE